jgi:GntR family transcriptional regulator, transcriptional repressor for pyruvate dehydrogenase complex
MRAPATRERLIEHLRGEILAGRLRPGAKLPPERALAQEFRLSRPIVREVLSGLQEHGLVDILPARGTFVRVPSAADGARSLETHLRRRNATVREVMDARLMLETHAARLAARHADAADLAALERTAADAEAAEGAVERARHDIAFHGLLARASHNTVVETMFASITGLTFELMLRSQADPDVVRRGMPYHRRVLDALRAGDADAAEAAMRAHLELAASLYGSDYERGVEGVAQRVLGPGVSLDGLLDELARRAGAA